jgi:Spy/CpxP family protein refolding chaperone
MSTKKKWITAVAAATVFAVGLYAQSPMGRHLGHHRGAAFLATYLDLTETQKTQAQAIFGAARTMNQPVTAQLRSGHEQMRELVKSGAPDSQIEALASQQGVLIGKTAGTYAKAFKQFYVLLTPEQKAKADKMHDHIRSVVQERLSGGGF